MHPPLTSIAIDTLEGTMNAFEGAWVIRGVEGELYPCKPDIFAATYEPVAADLLTDKPQTCKHGETKAHQVLTGDAPYARCPGPVSINPGETE